MPRYVDGSARCFRAPEPVYRSPSPPPYQPYAPAPGGYGLGHGSGGGSLSSGRLGGSHAAASKPSAKAAAPRAEAANPTSPAADASSSGPVQYATQPSRSAREGEAQSRRKELNQRYAPLPVPPPATGGFGVPVYLSNDDTMSLSSAQRVIWAIERFAPIPREHVRPHELLNYFSFHTAPVAPDHDFSVAANIAQIEGGQARLALSIQGRPLTRSTRRNVNLAYVVDRSGSMAAEGRMEYLKQGLLRSLDELKHGDVVHVTLFDTTVCQLAENFVVGRDNLSQLRSSIQRIQPEGSTNLHDGLRAGYEVADRAYQPTYSNRVVMITDAEANTGVTDQSLIATVGRHYDQRRIRLSGIGVGSTFNDSLLDELTERGRGAYVFLGSQAEVDAVFGSRFVSLVETIAGDVHFQLHLPPSLAMKTFYGEEASTVKERVQSVHYFANTAQLFLSDLSLRDGALRGEDDLMLTIEYEDPESGTARVEEFPFRIGSIAGAAPNLDKASLVDAFARNVQTLAERPYPASYAETRYGWQDTSAGAECRAARQDATRYAAPLRNDPEVNKIEGLWDTFCNRYPVAVAPRPLPRPVYPEPPHQRTNDFAPPDTWPGATSQR